jgi:hypothetical protein
MSEDSPFIGETIQVSTVTGDLYRALDGLVRLGVGPFQVFRMGPDNCVDFTHRGEPAEYSMLVAFANAGGMMWEAIQPLEGTSVFSEFLAAGHEGLHHVAVSCNGVPFDERVAGLEELGYERITGGRAFSGQVPFGYFINHDGPYYGFDHSIQGLAGANLVEIQPDFYKLQIPNGGSAKILTTITALPT